MNFHLTEQSLKNELRLPLSATAHKILRYYVILGAPLATPHFVIDDLCIYCDVTIAQLWDFE